MDITDAELFAALDVTRPGLEPVAKAVAAGIPAIVLDRRVIGDQYTCFIGADNRLIGREAGRWIAGTLGGRGKVVELAVSGALRWFSQGTELGSGP